MAALFKNTAIEEMLHIETLSERILFLEGEVEMEASRPVDKITRITAMLEKAVGGFFFLPAGEMAPLLVKSCFQ